VPQKLLATLLLQILATLQHLRHVTLVVTLIQSQFVLQSQPTVLQKLALASHSVGDVNFLTGGQNCFEGNFLTKIPFIFFHAFYSMFLGSCPDKTPNSPREFCLEDVVFQP
jgi:hypothetical protein